MKKHQEHGKEIPLAELKVLQMDVLSVLDEFCRNHQITYSLACGSMLGAIRHQGYIPWDDDIDIYLLRSDYEKLIQLFPDDYKGISLLSLERSKRWDKPYGKAHNNQTIVIENANSEACYGVNIDVFPIDDVPDDEEDWRNYDRQRRILQTKYSKIVSIIPLRFQPNLFVRWLFYKIYKMFMSNRKMAERIDQYSKKWEGKGYSRVFECCQGIFQKKPFKKSLFDSVVDYPFEDRQFLGFENYDEYLSNGFGDYMTLPPIEKRVTHHTSNAYWKK